MILAKTEYLNIKLEINTHNKVQGKKSSTVQLCSKKMTAVRYMFCAIFTSNSVAKFFKNTGLKQFIFSEVKEVATLLRMDSFRTIFKEKLTFILKTHRTAFVITVKFSNLLKKYF